jgi:lipopolysaccharide export system protein LptA/lipopolysaccharide export system protein LptC/plasmid stability protein
MTRWQRVLRLGLGAFAIAFAAVVYFAIGHRRPETASPVPPRADPKALAESVGGEALVARGAKSDYNFSYGRCLTYEGGTLKCDDVTILLPQRSGRDFKITAKKGTVTNDQASVLVEGAVELGASDGLKVSTEQATYDNKAGLVRVPGAVSFARGRMSGESVGANYDSGRDVLWLLDRVRVAFAADEHGAGAGTIEAGAAGFAKRDRYFRFERHVRITRAGQVVEADTAVAYMAPDEARIQTIELRGGARVAPTAATPSGLNAMSARDIDLAYGEDGETLQRAALSGDSVVQFGRSAEQEGRRLSGDAVDLGLGPDGTTLVSLAARKNVQLDLPGEAGATAKRIRSATLDAAGPPERGITSARFVDDVEFHETRPATKTTPLVDRTARSRTLDAVVKPGFGAIDAASFGGGVQFRDTGREAAAGTAVYNVAKGVLQLVAQGPGQGARVDDDRATVEGRKVDLTLDGGSLVADADVRSVLKAASRPGEGGPPRDATKAGPRRPGMLKDSQPVNVTAKHLVYENGTGNAVYTGDARLWQGETAVQADTITIDDSKGDLAGKGTVKSTLRLQQKDEKTGRTDLRTTVVTADQFRYEDALRRATYTGSARMNGPEGDLRSDRLELYLDATGSALDRVEAYDNVSLLAEKRSVTGARLTYYAADGRYLMSGTPVRVLEQLPQECRETLGRTLTFFRSTDSISVDGNEESRTQTTSGGRCPEPRVK